jgi:hypothetical protein
MAAHVTKETRERRVMTDLRFAHRGGDSIETPINVLDDRCV